MKLFSLLIFLSFSAYSQTKSSVEQFIPQGETYSPKTVSVQFSKDLKALGESSNFEPFKVLQSECNGYSQWVSPRLWKFRFYQVLKSGTRCTFSPTDPKVLGNQSYEFIVSQASIEELSPRGDEFEEGDKIETSSLTQVSEEQVFAVRMNQMISENDFVQRFQFKWIDSGVERISKIELVQLSQKKKKALSEKNSTLYLSEEGRPAFWFKSAQDFPVKPGAQIQLVDLSTRRTFYFRMRDAFQITFNCTRENESSACLPISGVQLHFSSFVSGKELQQIKIYEKSFSKAPQMSFKLNPKDEYQQISFDQYLKPSTHYLISVPHHLKDTEGRKHQQQNKFPLEFKTGPLPTLAKFASNFGLLESDSPYLPLTVRNTEKQIQYSQSQLVSSAIKPKAPEIFKWLSRLEKQQIRTSEEYLSKEDRKNKVVHSFQSLVKRYSKELGPSKTQGLDQVLEENKAEVIGIPLSSKGFHLVEFSSQILGKNLLSRKEPFFVASAALVTDLAVQLKASKSGSHSLVWVTELSSAKPVEGAKVRVEDCKGRLLDQGLTNADGVWQSSKIPSEQKLNQLKSSCLHTYRDHSYVVFAEKGDDYSFTLNEWNEGIEPWRYNLFNNYEDSSYKIHTIFARSLLLPGQSLQFKTEIRELRQNVLRKLEAHASQKFKITHLGTDQSWTVLTPSTNSEFFGDWKIPEEAPTGTYRLEWMTQNKNKNKKIEKGVDAGIFEVKEFKTPLIDLEIQNASQIYVNQPQTKQVHIKARYIQGGRAPGLTGKISFKKNQISPSIDLKKDFYFTQEDPIQVGIKSSHQENQSSQTNLERQTLEVEFKLDSKGEWSYQIPDDFIRTRKNYFLEFQVEFKDPSGELQTHRRGMQIWNQDHLIGIKSQNFYDVKVDDELKILFTALSLEGTKSLLKKPINAKIYKVNQFTHRSKLLGGVYGYESYHETLLLPNTCEMKKETDYFSCSLRFSEPGSYVLELSSEDTLGNALYQRQSIDVYGKDFYANSDPEGDRMMLELNQGGEINNGIIENQNLKVKVHTPFKESTNLLTYEREGVLKYEVHRLKQSEPVLSIKALPEFFPEVVISVLSVRGRVSKPSESGFLDLAKPSLKLGNLTLQYALDSRRIPIKVEMDKKSYQIRENVKLQIETEPHTRLTIAVVDEALLKVSNQWEQNALEQFYRGRNHQVVTASNLLQVIGKRHFGKKATPFGGGGGQAFQREDLDSLVAWIPNLKADSKGILQTQFKLKDGLSKYQVIVFGSNGDERFGEARTSFQTKQDFQILSGLPLFLRQGDQTLLRWTLRNTTSQDKKVLFRLKSDLRNSIQEKSIELKSNSQEEIDFKFQVPSDQSFSRIQFNAQMTDPFLDPNQLNKLDELLIPVAILPRNPLRVIDGDLIKVPAQSSQKKTVLSQENDSDLKASVELAIEWLPRVSQYPQALKDYMEQYPYSCLEQQVSQLVSRIASSEQFDSKAFTALIKKIPAYRDTKGLLKFFPQQYEGSYELTAYILKMLTFISSQFSGQLKYPKAFKAIQSELSQSLESYAKKPDEVWSKFDALSRIRSLQKSELDSLFTFKRSWKESVHLLNILLAHSTHTKSQDQEQINKLKQEVMNGADIRSETLSFASGVLQYNGGGQRFVLEDSSHTLQAKILLSFIELKDEELATKLLLHLLNETKKSSLDTTVANAYFSLALRQYQKAFEGMKSVNGKMMVNVLGESQVLTLDAKNLEGKLKTKTRSEMSYQSSSKDPTFVKMLLKSNTPLKSAVSRGFSISKQIKNKGQNKKIIITIDSERDQKWVVLSEPLPPGHALIEVVSEGVFNEIRKDRVQVYFESLPKGKKLVELELRSLLPGIYNLPPTKVEAMYQPTEFAEIPNQAYLSNE